MSVLSEPGAETRQLVSLPLRAAVPFPTGRVVAPPTRQPELPVSAPRRLVAEVLRAAEGGLTVDRIAERLGLPDELVALALDHAERIGLVLRPGGSSMCGIGCATAPDRPPACFGCPLAR